LGGTQGDWTSGGNQAQAGAANSGAGGGARWNNATGKAGGSGIVIIRYVTGGGVSDPYQEWRQLYFTSEELSNEAISGDNADPDGDGMSNVKEYWCGTRPNDDGSYLGFTALVSDPGAPGEFLVRWQSVSNKLYTLQAATNLIDGFTLILGSNIVATPPENVHTDNVQNAGSRFYRVEVK
jgi:hypothetical protein